MRIQATKKGTLHNHGHGGAKDKCCAWSYKLLATMKISATKTAVSAPTPSSLTDQSSQEQCHPSVTWINSRQEGTHSCQLSASSYQPSNSPSCQIPILEHPLWIRLMMRIPKSARPTCAATLPKTQTKISPDPEDLEAWNNLLSFGPVILAKPARDGAMRNLGKIIMTHLSSWKGETPTPAHQEKQRGKHHAKRPKTLNLMQLL